MKDVAPGSASDRILQTFLRLVAERGIDATTTRLLAEEAGVNEVTIFRLFGDKANLAARAVHHFQATHEIGAYPVQSDPPNADIAGDALVDVLSFLRRHMLERPEFVQFGIGEYWRLPHLKSELAATPRAARDLVERALVAASPFVRSGVDLRAASLTLVGLLLVSVVWPSRGWIEMSEDEWQSTARQAVELLLSS